MPFCRQGLSISLNFRPNRNKSTFISNLRFYSHVLLVILGFRPSITSVLRQLLLDYIDSTASSSLLNLAEAVAQIPSTAAFLTFCDGDRTVVLEKDLR